MLIRDIIRKQREILKTIDNKNVEIVERKTELNWDEAEQISYSTAKELFNFNIYSLRKGKSSVYYIGNKPPINYNKIKGAPAGCTWKYIRKPSYMYIRMITIDGIESNIYKKKI